MSLKLSPRWVLPFRVESRCALSNRSLLKYDLILVLLCVLYCSRARASIALGSLTLGRALFFGTFINLGARGALAVGRAFRKKRGCFLVPVKSLKCLGFIVLMVFRLKPIPVNFFNGFTFCASSLWFCVRGFCLSSFSCRLL